MKMGYIYRSYLCSSAHLVLGQSAFIETISKEDFLKNNSKHWLFDSLQNDARYLSVTPIRMNDLWSFQTGGELTFSLPTVQDPIRAVVTSPRRYTDSRYSWTGNVLNSQDEIVGHAVFFQEGDKKFGQVELRNRRFIIRDLNANIDDDQVLVEIDQAALPVNSCGTEGLNDPPGGPEAEQQVPPPPLPPPPPPPPDTCEAIVTVLFLHTQKVWDAGIDPVQLSTMGLHALNEAIDSSAIPNTELEVVSAGNVLFENYADTEDDSESIINELLPQDTFVQRLRNERRADLVILLTEEDIFYIQDNTINYGVVGLANVNEVTDSNKVYSVVEADHSGVTKTIVHEIGHLFGCRHRGGGHSYANGYQICLNPNAFGYCAGGTVNTIMNPSANDNTVLRFSNSDPNHFYQGAVVGNDMADNVRMIGNTACPISQFRMPLFRAFISGPTNVSNNPNTDYLYSSYYQNCPVGPVTYRWEVSWDYGNTFSHLSLLEDAVLDGADVPSQAPEGIIKLTAVCTGDTSIVFLDIKNWSAWNLVEEENPNVATTNGRKNIQPLNINLDTPLSVYPNPTTGNLNIRMAKPLTGAVSINLISNDGREQKLYESNLKKQEQRFSYDISHYAPGFYVLEIRTDTECFRTPIILTQQ
jgi:hypothetical protein